MHAVDYQSFQKQNSICLPTETAREFEIIDVHCEYTIHAHSMSMILQLRFL